MMRTLVSLAFVGMLGSAAFAQGAEKWVTSWAASPQGPYPIGNPSVQPNQSFHFPAAATGARDQSFRLIVRPDIWSRQVRLRLSNANEARHLRRRLRRAAARRRGGDAGHEPAGALRRPGQRHRKTRRVGVERSRDAALRARAGRAVRPQARGQLPRRRRERADDLARQGPADVLRHGAGRRREGRRRRGGGVPVPDRILVLPRRRRRDGRSRCAGDRRLRRFDHRRHRLDHEWGRPLAGRLARRLRAAYGNRVAVVNAGIGGNQVAGPPEYSPEKPFPGGPSAAARLDRDVIGLSGITTFIWLEGINDFSRNGNAAVEAVEAGMRDGVARLRAKIPGIRVLGATVVTALASTSAAHGFPEQDEKRKRLNEFIRTSGVFDAVLDFDRATLDPQTGGLKPEFVPDSTAGGPGDKLHPNRVGYLAIATSIDLKTLLGKELQPATR